MTLPIDILIAPEDQFDSILSDSKNTLPIEALHDAGVSIDDVVTIVAVHRKAIDDRQAWWKIRREVNAHFASHPNIASRTLARLPTIVRNEIAGFDESEVQAIADSWTAREDATPSTPDQAKLSLTALVSTCHKAVAESQSVFLRTSQAANAFEMAFSKLNDKQRANFQRAFDRWDEVKKHKAHQTFNHYLQLGLENSLHLVLRDFTRPKTTKINLKTDQRKIKRLIKERVKRYSKDPDPNLGHPNHPITLIVLSFDIEYEGFVDLVIDTRPKATDDICLEEHTDARLELDHWREGLQRLTCDELPLQITRHDESKVAIEPQEDSDEYETHIGEMLRDTLIEARDSGVFAKLPLAEQCVMLVAGTHSNFCWPNFDELHEQGRVL